MSVLYIVISAVVLAGFLGALFFSPDAVAKRRMRCAPRTRIAYFPEGAVGKIVGRLDCVGEPLVAPLSGRRGAQYHVLVEQYAGNLGLGQQKQWNTIVEDEKKQDFILTDETGHALVRVNGARIFVTEDKRYRSGIFRDAAPRLESFLAEHGHRSTGTLTSTLGLNRKLRYKEGVLESGEKVAIHGVGRWENNPSPAAPSNADGDQDEQQKRLVMYSSLQAILCISDGPGVTG